GQPSEEAMAAARAALGDAVDADGELNFGRRQVQGGDAEKPAFYVMSMAGFIWGAILSVAAAVLCRGGVLMRALGIAVVTRHGADASRLRMLWRATIAWAWMPLGGALVAMLVPLTGAGGAVAVTLTLIVAAVTWSAVTPGR